MRFPTFLLLTTTAATASAQQPDRPSCRDCATAAEARAATEARVARVRDSVRAIGFGSGGFENEIERLAAQLLVALQTQTQLRRSLEAIASKTAEAGSQRELALTARRLQAQFNEATRQRQTLRSQLVTLCDRTAKPQGYMGITFSAMMRADTAISGGEVFRFAEFPTVETVEPGSPAERAGVAKGDQILSIGGRSVIGRDIVFARLLRPGSKLPLRVRRDDESRDVTLLVGERPPALDNGCPWLDARITTAFADVPGAMAPPASGAVVRAMPAPAGGEQNRVGSVRIIRRPDAPPPAPAAGRYSEVIVAVPTAPMVPSVQLPAPAAPEVRETGVVYSVGGAASPMTIAGATIVRMIPDLRESLGVSNGVLVVDVARGSPAYASGLKGGDVIVSVGRAAVTTPLSIRRAMENAGDSELTLRVVRKKKPQSLVLRW